MNIPSCPGDQHTWRYMYSTESWASIPARWVFHCVYCLKVEKKDQT